MLVALLCLGVGFCGARGLAQQGDPAPGRIEAKPADPDIAKTTDEPRTGNLPAPAPLPGGMGGNPAPPPPAVPIPGVPYPGPVPVAPPPSPGNHLPNVPFTPRTHVTPDASRYIRQAKGPESVLEIVVGRLQIFDLLEMPKRVQIGDESVANYTLLSPRELSLQGLRVGTTVLNVWFNGPNNTSTLVGFTVRILPDSDARARLERAYRNLENEINKVFANSKISLSLIGDKLMVSGQARDVAEANMIMRMVQANVLPEAADSPDLGRSALSDPANTSRLIPAFHRSVVNMIRVIGEQQVMLQVQVVEVDRAASRSIGLNFGLFRNTGAFFIGGTTGNLAQTASGGSAFASFVGQPLSLTGIGGVPNLPVAVDNGQIQLAIAALRSIGYSRYLAEPNLVAINGQTANFQAGSLLPVPVIAGTATANLAGVNYIPTGVQLAFTPFITDRDRIRLTVNAEISDRDLNVAPTIIDGASVPSLVTRNFNTTVELREGQTLAVAGLIENKLDADTNRLPLLSMIPVLGRLAGYDRIANREKELVILVTPRLVHPLDCREVPPLPGGDLLDPTDCEFYLLGRIESHTGFDYRSPIRTDCDRRKQFRILEESHLLGPSGPTVDVPSEPEAPAPAMNPGAGSMPPPIPGTPAPLGPNNAAPTHSAQPAGWRSKPMVSGGGNTGVFRAMDRGVPRGQVNPGEQK